MIAKSGPRACPAWNQVRIRGTKLSVFANSRLGSKAGAAYFVLPRWLDLIGINRRTRNVHAVGRAAGDWWLFLQTTEAVRHQ